MVFGVIMGVISSWVFAITFTLNRRIKDIHYSVIIFWHSVIGATGSLVVVLILWGVTGNPPLSYSPEGWLWLNCASVFDFFCIFSQIVAFQSDNSSFVALLSYSSVVYAFLCDIFIFKEVITGF